MLRRIVLCNHRCEIARPFHINRIGISYKSSCHAYAMMLRLMPEQTLFDA